MNAQELMIGDWVYGLVVDEGNDLDKIIEKVPSKVTMINEFGDVNTTGPFPIDDDEYNGEWEWYDIEPIPLTPEILEKNGWFYPKQSSWMKLDNPNRELWGCIHTDGTLWLYSSGDCDKDESFAEIKYVHELQHALRMAGIEKEVAL